MSCVCRCRPSSGAGSPPGSTCKTQFRERPPRSNPAGRVGDGPCSCPRRTSQHNAVFQGVSRRCRRDPRIIDLLLRYEEMQEQGRPITPEELCCDCTELLDELRRGIADLKAAQEHLNLPPDRRRAGWRTLGRVHPGRSSYVAADAAGYGGALPPAALPRSRWPGRGLGGPGRGVESRGGAEADPPGEAQRR